MNFSLTLPSREGNGADASLLGQEIEEGFKGLNFPELSLNPSLPGRERK
jgi:hypothetical protein